MQPLGQSDMAFPAKDDMGMLKSRPWQAEVEQHVRQGLLQYGQSGVNGVRLRRKDTGATVEVEVDPSSVHGDPAQRELLGKILSGVATGDDKKRFAQLWQDRVRRLLLDHADDPQVVKVRKLS